MNKKLNKSFHSLGRLKDHGWTDEDLYRQYLPVGIAHLHLWKKEGVISEIFEGSIFFTWKNRTGKTITQRCRPEKRWRKNG